jgi:hypothetical protein
VLSDPGRATELARRGKEHVRRQYLTPRLVRDWLRLADSFRAGVPYPAEV